MIINLMISFQFKGAILRLDFFCIFFNDSLLFKTWMNPPPTESFVATLLRMILEFMRLTSSSPSRRLSVFPKGEYFYQNLHNRGYSL